MRACFQGKIVKLIYRNGNSYMNDNHYHNPRHPSPTTCLLPIPSNTSDSIQSLHSPFQSLHIDLVPHHRNLILKESTAATVTTKIEISTSASRSIQISVSRNISHGTIHASYMYTIYICSIEPELCTGKNE